MGVLYVDHFFGNCYLTHIDIALQGIAIFTFIVIGFIKCCFIKHKTRISAYRPEKGNSRL